MPGAHATLSPSGAERWMQCPGSVPYERNFPDKSSSFADEGTAAHEIGELALLSKAKLASAFVGHKTEVGIEADEEMCKFVQVYVDAVMDYVDPEGQNNMLLVERRVDFSPFIGYENSTGTADAIVITQDDELQVHDLKFGRGVEVSAEENKQLMLYALGALNDYGMLGDFKQIRMVIHQPRLRARSEWVISLEDLLTFGKEAKAAAKRAMGCLENGFTTEDLIPGEKGCRFCKAKAECKALNQHVSEVVTGKFDDLSEGDPEQVAEGIKVVIEELSAQEPDVLAKAMQNVGLIEQFCKAVRAAVFSKLESGDTVEGFKLVKGKLGNRAWVDADKAEEVLKSMRVKKDDMYSLKLISPTAAEKLLKDNNPRKWSRLQEQITRKDGQPSVAPLSDKRPALQMEKTEDKFSDETLEDLI